QASIRRCRCRTREARSGATALELLEPSVWRATSITAQKSYTARSVSRKIARRYLSKANHENAAASGSLAHHPSAAPVPDRLLSHPVCVCSQDQPGRDGTTGAAVHGHPHAHGRRPSAALDHPCEL